MGGEQISPHAITKLAEKGKASEAASENRLAGAGQFQLQKGLFSETMPLTAEVPVSRPRWLGFPDCPCERLLCLQRAPRLASGFRAEGVGR